MAPAIRIALLCAALLPFCAPAAAASGDARPGDIYSANAVLGFTRHLISKKEYYRAHAELMRLRSYYPGTIPMGRAYATELFLLFYGGQYDDVNLVRPPGDHTSRCIDAIFKADSRFASGEYKKAFALADEGRAMKCSPDLARILGKRAFASALLAGGLESAGRMAEEKQFSAAGEFDPSYYTRLIAATRQVQSSYKNPVCAAALGILPGLGYAYAGDVPTGIIAFLTFSALGALAAGAYLTDNKPLAFFFGLGATLVYGGSVLGGYRQALRHNQVRSRDWRERIEGELSLDADRQRIFRQYGIGDEPGK